MATVQKAMSEFAGEEKENVEEWIKTLELLSGLASLTEIETIRVAVFSMRGQARVWVSSLFSSDTQLSWSVLKTELKTRFSTQKITAEVLNKFFSRAQAKSYNEYLDLLREASTIFERGCINAEPLMKQVIARSPSELKPILLLAAQQGCSWVTFLRHAENNGWVAFPEKIVNHIYQGNNRQYQRENVKT